MAPVLEVLGLSVHLRTRRGLVHAVDDVSFSVGERETLAIVGESGSGKSVTSRSIVGLFPPRVVHRRTGQVRLPGRGHAERFGEPPHRDQRPPRRDGLPGSDELAESGSECG